MANTADRSRSSRALSRRLDTKIAIYSPPAADDIEVQNSFGEVDRTAGQWELVGYDWAELTIAGASSSPTAGQAGTVQIVSVLMRKRTDVLTTYRFEVLNGPLAGSNLYLDSITYDVGAGVRTMTVACQMA